MTIQEALQNTLSKFGKQNYKGVMTASIPLHRSDYVSQLDSETVEVLMHLPYAFDDTGALKYSVKKSDQVINLTVWM